jgi:hypothetical protein
MGIQHRGLSPWRIHFESIRSMRYRVRNIRRIRITPNFIFSKVKEIKKTKKFPCTCQHGKLNLALHCIAFSHSLHFAFQTTSAAAHCIPT